MSIILCPECNEKVSTTLSSCPHCGFHLKEESNFLINNKPSSYVLAKRNKTVSVASGIVSIILGDILSVFLIGIFIIIDGISDIITVSKNNRMKYECAYFESNSKIITLYAINGETYSITPENIIYIRKVAGGYNLIVKAIIQGKKKKIDCGLCSRQEILNFRNEVEQMQRKNKNIENN